MWRVLWRISEFGSIVRSSLAEMNGYGMENLGTCRGDCRLALSMEWYVWLKMFLAGNTKDPRLGPL